MIYESNNELMHYGVLGMKWGVRHDKTKSSSYSPTSIKARIARRQNKKVDASFKQWAENSKKRENAIMLGKKANVAKRAYETSGGDKNLKKEYKQSKKAYNKALKDNTRYRQGQIRNKVGADLSRKYLSEAKKVKKQLDSDPSNKQLRKKYNDLKSKHDVERAKARKALSVGANRSRKVAAIKRTAKMSAITAVSGAAITSGIYAVNRYLSSHNTTLNGKPLRVNSDQFKKVVNVGKSIFGVSKYTY